MTADTILTAGITRKERDAITLLIEERVNAQTRADAARWLLDIACKNLSDFLFELEDTRKAQSGGKL